MAERILLVEPATSVALLVKQELEAAGMDVTTARDAQMARRLLESQPAELVLIESNLYSSGGLDLLTGIRRSRLFSELPVIILGSREGGDENVHWLEAGADSTIPRPFSAAVLVAKLHAVLRRAKLKIKTCTE